MLGDEMVSHLIFSKRGLGKNRWCPPGLSTHVSAPPDSPSFFCAKQGGKMNHSHPDPYNGKAAFGRSCTVLRQHMQLTQGELARLLIG